MPTHLVAHVSDLHLDGGPGTLSRARQVMTYLDHLTTPVDAVLITGDLTADGRPEEYAQVVGLLSASRHPVFTCPGNHDARAAYRAALVADSTGAARPVHPDEPVNRVHRTDAVVYAMCDSVLPGESGGHLSDATLAWLDGVLRDTPDDTPVVVGFHHPPVALHSPVLDGIRQRGAERLATVLARYPNVAAVLCGHAHTPAATSFAGRPLRVAPGVYSTLTLPWERGELLDPSRPPGLAFHVLDLDGPDPASWSLVTHYRTITPPPG